MQRKATKNTRGPNSDEKAFQRWVKEHDCCYCPAPGPSIVDHANGATLKHNKVLVGHWLVTAKCLSCDTIKTQGNRNWHNEKLGKTESEAWLELALEYTKPIPEEVICAIENWGK